MSRLLLRAWASLRETLFRTRHERDLAEEISTHLAMASDDNLRRGLSPEEARYAALRSFGGLEQMKEAYRDRRGFPFLETLLRDLRYAVRTLAKAPGFTAVVVVTLALGIGVNTTIFTALNIPLRPPAVGDPGSLVELQYDTPQRRRAFSFPNFVYFRDHSRVFAGLAAHYPERFLLGRRHAEGPLEITGSFVSSNFFALLGADTALGRTFAPAETGAPGSDALVVLSHHFWQRQFAGDPGVAGRTLLLNGKPFTVIGVTSASFGGLGLERPDIWLPLMKRGDMPTVWDMTPSKEDWFANRSFRWLNVVGRLRPGYTVEDAGAEAAVLLRQLAQAHPEVTAQDAVRMRPAAALRMDPTEFWTLSALVLGASGLVLLIACSNIANLLLARAASRRREIGVRLCLGASRGRLVRQLLTESLLLAGLGGGCGLLLAWWSADLLSATALDRFGAPQGGGLILPLTPDLRILAFTLGVSVLSGALCGLLPAWRATRADPIAALRDEGGAFGRRLSGSGLRNGLVVAQMALCLLLLIPAGVLLRGLRRALVSDPGFPAKKILQVGYSLELSGYDPARARLFHQQLVERLAGLHGVEAVSSGGFWRGRVGAAGPEDGQLAGRQFAGADFQSVSAGYFAAMAIPIVRGRAFTREETRARSPFVVVSEATARAWWPGANPIGRTVRAEISPGGPQVSAQVIGVARDVRHDAARRAWPVVLYLPGEPDDFLDARILLRTARDAEGMKALVTREVHALEPVVRLWLNTLDEIVTFSKRVRGARAASDLAAILGLLALALAGVGLYGVMAYSVTERRREIGIRMALGARRGDVQRAVLARGLRLVAIGAVPGVAGGAAISRLLTAALFDTPRLDPAAYLAVTLFLMAVSLAAMLIPARRAARVDAMTALRAE